MELANPNPQWRDEAYRVLRKHLGDPRYPKPLTGLELEEQVYKLRGSDLTELAGQWGGGGKLKSQFLNYIRQCNCACWSSWKVAWKDFDDFMGFTEERTLLCSTTVKSEERTNE